MDERRLAEFQCTFWCSVLSNGTNKFAGIFTDLFQCTFWCSVLSNFSKGGENVEHVARFNAPSGAQCFPTRQPASGKNKMIPEFQCTFWCSVLSNLERKTSHGE